MFDPQAFLSTVETEPGVYQMLDHTGEVIYVGKAKNLKKRLSSYFLNVKDRDVKTRLLVTRIASIQTMVTRTESEALILERQLIRTLQPRYNIALKDDKSYPFVKVTVQEPFPRVLVVRQRDPKDGARYFGPFPSVGSTRHLQRMLHDLFLLRQCTQQIDLEHRQPKCILLDLNKCLGPCVLKDVKPAYDADVKQVMDILSGRSRSLLHSLRENMWELAEKHRFEQAAVLRNHLHRLEAMTERQRVQMDPTEDVQVWVYATDEQFHYALVQTFLEGKLLYQNGFYLEHQQIEKSDFLREAVVHFMDAQNPALVDVRWSYWLVDEDFESVLQEDWWQQDQKVPRLIAPKRGENRAVLDLAVRNAAAALTRLTRQSGAKKGEALLSLVKQALGLERPPFWMACIDISHFQGQDIVGSAVVFKEGKPFKDRYRRFRIQSVSGQSDDPRSIREVVVRFLSHLKAHELDFPSLLVIDGGKPQLGFAVEGLESLALDSKIELVALAKKEELLFFHGREKPLRLSHRDPALQLLQRIRDEAHRFALRYQRSTRIKRFSSVLESIKGLGDKRMSKIYSVYGSLEALEHETDTSLAEKTGLPLPLAIEVLQRVRKKEWV